MDGLIIPERVEESQGHGFVEDYQPTVARTAASPVGHMHLKVVNFSICDAVQTSLLFAAVFGRYHQQWKSSVPLVLILHCQGSPQGADCAEMDMIREQVQPVIYQVEEMLWNPCPIWF